MQLQITLTLEEIRTLLNEFAPIRLHMTKRDEDRRWLELEAPTAVDLVPGRGVRVVTHGRLRYEIAAVKVPATIKELKILLKPRVVQSDETAHRLAFELEIEQGDLALIPNLIDDVLVSKVNAALTPRATNMVWDFGAALTRSATMPDRLEPLDEFRVRVTGGSAEVVATHVRFIVQLGAEITRDRARPADD